MRRNQLELKIRSHTSIWTGEGFYSLRLLVGWNRELLFSSFECFSSWNNTTTSEDWISSCYCSIYSKLSQNNETWNELTSRDLPLLNLLFCGMIGILEEWLLCKWCNDLIEIDLLIHVICMQNRIMNKNEIKKRKKKLLVSFWSSEVSSSFEDVVAWRFRQHFVVTSSPKVFSRVLAILRFFSLAQVLDVEIPLTSVCNVSNPL